MTHVVLLADNQMVEVGVEVDKSGKEVIGGTPAHWKAIIPKLDGTVIQNFVLLAS